MTRSGHRSQGINAEDAVKTLLEFNKFIKLKKQIHNLKIFMKISYMILKENLTQIGLQQTHRISSGTANMALVLVSKQHQDC